MVNSGEYSVIIQFRAGIHLMKSCWVSVSWKKKYKRIILSKTVGDYTIVVCCRHAEVSHVAPHRSCYFHKNETTERERTRHQYTQRHTRRNHENDRIE